MPFRGGVSKPGTQKKQMNTAINLIIQSQSIQKYNTIRYSTMDTENTVQLKMNK